MTSIRRSMIVISALVGASAVGLGAFGAHGLSSLLSQKAMSTFQTGNLYHHLFALFLLVLSLVRISEGVCRSVQVSYWMALVGVVLFSGSLYLLAVRSLFVLVPISIVGPVTPIGGLFLIGAWLSLIGSILGDQGRALGR